MRSTTTGHRDCCGDMIRRGDYVCTAGRIPEKGLVVWVGKQWILRYADGASEPLNNYGARDVRRTGQSWDNALSQISIVPGQHFDCPTIVPPYCPELIDEYLGTFTQNGTMGQ